MLVKKGEGSPAGATTEAFNAYSNVLEGADAHVLPSGCRAEQQQPCKK